MKGREDGRLWGENRRWRVKRGYSGAAKKGASFRGLRQEEGVRGGVRHGKKDDAVGGRKKGSSEGILEEKRKESLSHYCLSH